MGVLKKSDSGKVVRVVKVHFQNSSLSPCYCCCSSSVSTHVSQKLYGVKITLHTDRTP